MATQSMLMALAAVLAIAFAAPLPSGPAFGWYFDGTSRSCAAVCPPKAPCDATFMNQVVSVATFQYAAANIVNGTAPVCSSYGLRNLAHGPGRTTAGVCTYQNATNPISTCDAVYSGARLCCCGGDCLVAPAPTTEATTVTTTEATTEATTTEATTVTTATTPSMPPGWVLSAPGASCSLTCQKRGATCNADPPKDVNTEAKMRFVADRLAVNCESMETAMGEWVFPAVYNTTVCKYNAAMALSICESSSHARGSRFCCCSENAADCPVANAPEPFVPGWVRSHPGASCAQACSARGATCNVDALNAVDTADKLLFVADTLNMTCSSVTDISTFLQSNPELMVELGVCNFNPAGHLSTCDAKGDMTSPAQRFCCCAENAADCSAEGDTSSTVGWVLSAVNVSCTEACQLTGGVCNKDAMDAVDTAEKLGFVANALQVLCPSIVSAFNGTETIPLPDAIEISGDCWYNSVDPVSTCESKTEMILSVGSRFCCCSNDAADCPIDGDAFSPNAWILGEGGASCSDTCQSYGEGVCSVDAMNALDTEEKVLFVASALGIECQSFWDSESFDASPETFVVDKLCLYNSLAPATTCEANDVAPYQYPTTRMCCCSDNIADCPVESSLVSTPEATTAVPVSEGTTTVASTVAPTTVETATVEVTNTTKTITTTMTTCPLELLVAFSTKGVMGGLRFANGPSMKDRLFALMLAKGQESTELFRQRCFTECRNTAHCTAIYMVSSNVKTYCYGLWKVRGKPIRALPTTESWLVDPPCA